MKLRLYESVARCDYVPFQSSASLISRCPLTAGQMNLLKLAVLDLASALKRYQQLLARSSFVGHKPLLVECFAELRFLDLLILFEIIAELHQFVQALLNSGKFSFHGRQGVNAPLDFSCPRTRPVSLRFVRTDFLVWERCKILL